MAKKRHPEAQLDGTEGAYSDRTTSSQPKAAETSNNDHNPESIVKRAMKFSDADLIIKALMDNTRTQPHMNASHKLWLHCALLQKYRLAETMETKRTEEQNLQMHSHESFVFSPTLHDKTGRKSQLAGLGIKLIEFKGRIIYVIDTITPKSNASAWGLNPGQVIVSIFYDKPNEKQALQQLRNDGPCALDSSKADATMFDNAHIYCLKVAQVSGSAFFKWKERQVLTTLNTNSCEICCAIAQNFYDEAMYETASRYGIMAQKTSKRLKGFTLICSTL